MARQLTTKAGNPAHALHTNYANLMQISDLTTLRNQALGLVAKSGISDKNLAKFRRTIQQQTSVAGAQRYPTNFVLAADGLAVCK